VNPHCAEGCLRRLDILHADNGSSRKSSTLRATLEQLGIEPTYSGRRVNNDNPYTESLFRITKYRPDYPVGGFIDIEAARQ
jgi:putative transposase